MEDSFLEMSEKIKLLDSMSNENKLYLYKYYKQATIGDINIEEPSGWFNFEAKEKYKAWKSVENTSKDNSMKKYIEKCLQLLNE
jgi:diazepam-binding inhibitor (GABA receptor modulating acyl-CoA-binding protein)